jgi:hypothetical protein
MTDERFLQQVFDAIASLERIDRAEGDFIPTSASASPKDRTLFVNCIYDLPETLTEDACAKLDLLRADSWACIERVASETPWRMPFSGVCVSLFEIPEEGTNLRLYRIYLPRKQIRRFLKNNAESIEGLQESSSVKEIQKILSNNGDSCYEID